MRTIDSNQAYRAREERLFRQAEDCPELLYDKNAGSALWHRCFCGHIGFIDGMPQHCNLVWRGKCVKESKYEAS